MAVNKPEKGASSDVPTILRVSSFAQMRCRAGRQFTTEPVDLPLESLTDSDIEAIESDPQLKTERV
jgi:hypothetical protein